MDREALVFYLTQNYSAEQLSNELFKLTLEVPGDRLQLVFVCIFESNFTVFSPVIPFSPENSTALLQAASEVGVLGVSIFDGMLCLTNACLNFDGLVLDDWITTIASAADGLEAGLTGGQDKY